MDILDIYFFGFLVLVLFTSAGVGDLQPAYQRLVRCKHVVKHGKHGVNCHGLNLIDVPPNLSDNIETLVASGNRIRELTNHSLQRYSSLESLYLANNFINHIEPGAFIVVPKLEVLDLSMNAIRKMPGQLPLPLRQLNLNTNRGLEIELLTQAFNLQSLDLGECHLTSLPDLGELPNLIELNVTGNEISSISAKQLAPLCRLEILHIPNDLFLNKRDSCLCQEFVYWKTKYISSPVLPFNCTELSEFQHELCLSNRSVWSDARNECLSRTPPFSLTSTRFIVPIGVVSVIIVLTVICCLWRRSKRKHKSSAATKLQNLTGSLNHVQTTNLETQNSKMSTIV